MLDNNFKLQQIALHFTQIMNSYVFVHYEQKMQKFMWLTKTQPALVLICITTQSQRS